MAQERNDQDLMHYEALAQEALRGVVKAALKRAASPGGLPGAHHFYITFKTRAAGVSAPAELAERYPDEMTIVLQHQYWDLAPGDAAFAVTLKFGGQPKKLLVPYAAVTRFYDPSVQFLLQFEPPEGVDGVANFTPNQPETLTPRPRKGRAAPAVVDAEGAEDETPVEVRSDEPNIVSLDQFRKK
ncbi:MAG TPA: ClpXP protease specificity-enhancing factor SspB [Caulobacteraceae bacterium]|nr:ClpXP protease specificity-enhancing factor SspB [Caulobacteraceae bacterium]